MTEPDLWLDPRRVKDHAFISHAHADHFSRARRILCSPANAALLKARYSVAEDRFDRLDWGEAREEHGYRYQLFPAGHVLGSAMLKATRLNDGASLLYTGDFKLRKGLAAEAPEPVEADVLVMETTFGLPKYVFPPAEDIHRDILQWCDQVLADGDTPVFLAYSLGKAQEIMRLLGQVGHVPLVHQAVFSMSQIYRRFLPEFPEFEPFPENPEKAAGRVLVFPPGTSKKGALTEVPNRKTAMLSGWGMNSSAKYRYRCDEVFPLSDHADFPDLLKFVEKVDPKRVLTLHGAASEFASVLRRKGREAYSLEGDDQLDLLFE